MRRLAGYTYTATGYKLKVQRRPDNWAYLPACPNTTTAAACRSSGVIKDWMLIFFSFYLFHAPVTALNLVGYAFCCSGVVIYNHMKLKAIRQRAGQTAKDDASSGARGDEERGGGGRSRDDILSEIRRLQEEMGRLEGSSAEGAAALGAAAGGDASAAAGEKKE